MLFHYHQKEIQTLKYGFCNKSFRKDEPLTSWTLFSTFLSSKLDSPSPMFWLEENLILSNVLIRGEFDFDDTYVQLVRGSSFRNDLLQNPYFSYLDYYTSFNYSIICTKLVHKMNWKWTFSCKSEQEGYKGGFHLNLLIFPFFYQFNFRKGVLVHSSFPND